MWSNKKYNIYSDKNYNRYIYKSNFRVDKNLFDDNIQINIKKLEKLLFTGKTHLKRGHGIQIISDTLKKLDNFNFDNYFSFFTTIKSMVQPPDLLIYLKCSVPTLVAQIQKRRRRLSI